MKKIIFITGTSYSGSTLLDLILSNNQSSISVGEIESIFNPVKPHHLKKIKEIKYDPIWGKILKNGAENLYNNLHDTLGVETIIDSSKNPAWIQFHLDRLPKNISYSVILVYKSLPEFKYSFEKRGRYNWAKVYKRFHSLLFNTIENFYRIEYKEIPLKSEKFLTLLDSLNIKPSKNIFEFWKQSKSNFFGNNNANIAFKQNQEGNKPKLEYKPIISKESLTNVKKLLENDLELKEIVTFLKSKKNSSKSPKSKGVLDNYKFRILIKRLRVYINKIKYIIKGCS